jgi:hypothetical protein
MDNKRVGFNVHTLPADSPTWCSLKRINGGWIRIDVNFADIEPYWNVFKWDELDATINTAVAKRFNIFASISTTPDWAALKGSGRAAVPTTAAWTTFVSAVVARYKGKVNYWGIWNEPDNKTFFSGSVSDYIYYLLKPVAGIIRSADKANKICAPDMIVSGHWGAWQKFYNTIMKEAGDCVDVITVHRYRSEVSDLLHLFEGNTIPWYEGPNLKQVTAAACKAGKLVWFTETGWNSAKGMDKQAGSYNSFLEWFDKCLWMDKVFFYEIQDDPQAPDSTYGILTWSGVDKPAVSTVTFWLTRYGGSV